LIEDFQSIGRDLFQSGLVSSHGGNMSVRQGDRILITRRGSMIGHLEKRDLIETGLHQNDSGIALASTELLVHRAVYRATSALAIVHAHPRVAIALSMHEDTIIPLDTEGSYLLHKVPVVAVEFSSGSTELAEVIADILKTYKIAMLRGHGCFSTGQMLEEAYQWVSVLEETSQIIYYSRLLRGEVKEYRKHSEEYKTW
jgi:L-fuculose-phosphate aldolase